LTSGSVFEHERRIEDESEYVMCKKYTESNTAWHKAGSRGCPTSDVDRVARGIWWYWRECDGRRGPVSC
jgi:hypothetical protein